ncbi:hypothetical protein [Paenibacillus ginsengihumi]|uniref:hypothetical protein n=1 Tax=Paenibacillus ginsengihumi TaxID=431596 RepID=UPI00037B5B57|nr:hypothetical protein [Paenibacillus ginsengihumi]
MSGLPPEPQEEAAFGADPADVQANRWIAAVSYLLFFLPLLAAKQSRFAMFHANQALTLLLAAIAANIVLGWIPIVGAFLLSLINLGLLVLVIIGILNATSGLMKPLPIIGSIKILPLP